MTDQQRDEFLAEKRVGVLAIGRAGGGPLCAPVWYRRDAEGGFEIAMADGSAKAARLRAEGRATLCVQDEGFPYRYVTVEGPVSLRVLSKAEKTEVLADIASRYMGEKAGPKYAANFGDHDEALVTLTPTRWRTEIIN